MTFCQECRSHFCTHAAPAIYAPNWGKLTAILNRFADATNTLVLDRSHEQGNARGARGEAYACETLNAQPNTGRAAPYDITVADGTRVDVKTTKHGMPLMVPAAQRYKLDPRRVDALLLVWDGHELQLRGQTSVTTFLERHRTDGMFPIPTLHLDAAELDDIPPSWFA